MFAVILPAVSMVLIIYLVIVYNGLVNCKNNVAKAWANIDVLLKQRHDELPKLIDTCKQYMQFEQATLEKVLQARNRVASASASQSPRALGNAEGLLRNDLGALFAVAESYPELKASSQFQFLQARITGLENSISDRREFYNETVNIYNIRIEAFPDVLIARQLNYPAKDMLRFSDKELEDVDVAQHFS